MAENGIQDDFTECPLCMEPLALDDINFYPCACRYQICRFCWHRIRTDENGLCPHCREPYSENPAEYTPPTPEQMAKLKSEKKQKTVEKRQKIIESRKSLASVRVVQKNLVFVIGLSPRLADPEVLKKNEYFGKFGRIYKVVINNHTVYSGVQGPSVSAYVTYVRNEDASKAITAVNNAYIDGRYLKASFGTTKYCTCFLRGMQCTKPDCMYLHELGDNDASFTKEDMQLGKHQVYETATLASSNVPVPFKEPQQQNHQLQQQHSVGGTGGGVKIKHVAHKPTATENAESALPATASWGSSVKSVSPATNHSSDSAQQSSTKDTKSNSHAAVSHSHSVGTSKHKHQHLVKSHSHSPSHGTGTGQSSSSHSRSTKLGSKESHHSRTKSGPLSPALSNEPTSKRESSRESEHNRSNSTGKSTPSLSPKSTLSESSSTGSLRHEVESDQVVSESKAEGTELASRDGSLNTSKEEEEEEREDVAEEEGGIEAVISGNERGEEGGWCQIDDSTEESSSPSQVPADKTPEEVKEVAVCEAVADLVLEEKGNEGGEVKDGTGDVEQSESNPVVHKEVPAPPPHQSTEDSSIVKVIPSLGSGVGQLGSLGVSWNTPLPQQVPSSIEATPQAPPTEDVATPTSSTDHEDELGFDPWNVSQQGLADLMKSEQTQQQHYSFPNQSSVGQIAPPTNPASHGSLSNGIGHRSSGPKSNMLQEEFKALFPNVNVSFEGTAMSSGGGGSLLSSSALSLSGKPGLTPTTTSSYIPSRLDSALSSTYHPPLGTSPMPPMTSSSSVAPGGSLKMFLGQHQPGFPSSSIKVHPRAPGSGSGNGGTGSVGSKMGASDWPDLGVSITSKSSSTQWSNMSNDVSTASSKDIPTGSASANTTTSSSLPPPPPGFTAKTTPTTLGSASFPGTTVSSSGSTRAPGSTLNNTVNHSLWTGGVANPKGNVAMNHPLLQSWANFMKFSSLTPTQQQQLARGSQVYQQLLIQQQYLIRQGLLLQSTPYHQAQAQVIAQAQTNLRAQLQQNLLRQQQIATTMAALGQKCVNSATSSTSSSSGTVPTTSGSGSVAPPTSHSANQQQGTSQHTGKTSSENGVKSLNHGGGEGGVASQASGAVHPPRPHNPQTNSAKQRTASSKSSKNSGGSSVPHSSSTHTTGNIDRKSTRVKAK